MGGEENDKTRYQFIVLRMHVIGKTLSFGTEDPPHFHPTSFDTTEDLHQLGY
jgi:hypothetical protein